MNRLPAPGPAAADCPTPDRVRFWTNWLQIASVFFGLKAVFWVFIGNFDPFGLYTGLLARAFWETDALPPDAARTFAFMVVPLGATTAGYFILVFFIVRYVFPRRERWAWTAVTAALLTWFLLDSIFSWRHGAFFNIVLVNITCLLVMGAPLAALWRWFFRPPVDRV